jgi:hypothetical protein
MSTDTGISQRNNSAFIDKKMEALQMELSTYEYCLDPHNLTEGKKVLNEGISSKFVFTAFDTG